MKLTLNSESIGGSIGTFIIVCIALYYRAMIFTYLQKIAEDAGKRLYRKHFKNSAIDIAKHMNELVNFGFNVALKHCKEAFAMEMKVLSEINHVKAKIGDPSKEKKRAKYEEKLKFLEDDYAKRMLVSSLTRTLINQADQTRTLVNELVRKLLSLADSNPNSIKDDDLKELQNAAEKPKLLNEEVDKIIACADLAKTLREKLFAAKCVLDSRSESFALTPDNEKLKALRDDSQKDYDALLLESSKADDEVKKSVLSIQETININLQLTGLNKLFENIGKEEVKDVELGNVGETKVEEKEFDWEVYVNNYLDLKTSGISTEEKAKKHYESFGKKEGRVGNKKISTDWEDFDWQYYINTYQDLAKVGINDELKALQHYTNFGKKEGRLGVNK